MNKKVIIITINYNQALMTIDCIDSVFQSDYNNFKLIIVDNGSTIENYLELEKYCKQNINIEVHRIEKNIGYVGGVNTGLDIARQYNPEYFIIMNNDIIIDENAISAAISVADKHNQNAIVAGKVYYFDKPDTFQTTGSIYTKRKYLQEFYPGRNEKDIGQCEEETERGMIDDIFWILPKKIFDSNVFYSDNFFLYGEQVDYALKAHDKGFKLIYSPKIKIWHKVSATTGGGNRIAQPVNYWRHKSSIILLYRNIKLRHFLIRTMQTSVKLIVKFIISSKDRKTHISAIRGHIDGIKWVFNQKPDNGYNPFLKKSNNKD